jgi:hypothetical protein
VTALTELNQAITKLNNEFIYDEEQEDHKEVTSLDLKEDTKNENA